MIFFLFSYFFFLSLALTSLSVSFSFSLHPLRTLWTPVSHLLVPVYFFFFFFKLCLLFFQLSSPSFFFHSFSLSLVSLSPFLCPLWTRNGRYLLLFSLYSSVSFLSSLFYLVFIYVLLFFQFCILQENFEPVFHVSCPCAFTSSNFPSVGSVFVFFFIYLFIYSPPLIHLSLCYFYFFPSSPLFEDLEFKCPVSCCCSLSSSLPSSLSPPLSFSFPLFSVCLPSFPTLLVSPSCHYVDFLFTMLRVCVFHSSCVHFFIFFIT